MGETFKKAERDTLGAVSLLIDLFGGDDGDYKEAADYVRSKIGNVPDPNPREEAPSAHTPKPNPGANGGTVDLEYCAKCAIHYFPGGAPHQCTPDGIPRPPPPSSSKVACPDPIPACSSASRTFFCSHCGKRNKVDSDD